jgi:hypothetical protein
MRQTRAWTMPANEARTFLQLLHEKIASSQIEVRHRDVLIRLQAIIEEDLVDQTAAGPDHATHDENDQERTAA